MTSSPKFYTNFFKSQKSAAESTGNFAEIKHRELNKLTDNAISIQWAAV